MRDGATALASGQGETIIEVELPGRSYPVVIGEGLVATAGRRIAAALPGARCAVVSDRNVAALYFGPLKAGLDREGLFLGEAVVSPGEASKSFSVLAPLCESLLELGVERGDCVIALGGGVVGDLAGFAASILRRGVRVVQMPTSLLAQVDSSVGGKTGIDTRQGKNLIGTFHQPSLVLADIATLKTLSPREFRAGYAEVVKYGLIGDAPFFAWLEQNWGDIFSAAGGARRRAVETSVRAKAAIVAADEREESGTRALLNPAAAWRGDHHRHAARLRLLRRAWAMPARRRRPGRAPFRGGRSAGRDRGDSRRHALAQRSVAAHGPGQESEGWQARAGAGARHRPGLCRA
jgi:3-dehydroquinate synthetase